MNDLRNLLLDCRSALRRADRTFEDGPLRPRLDSTIIAMSTAKAEREDDAAEPPTFSAQQVAYAWQQAARELHFTHPALYAELGEWVRERLQSDTLVDPGTEIIQAQGHLQRAHSDNDSLRADLAALRTALAGAVALEGTDAIGTESECAQRRLQILLDSAQRGGGLPKPRPEDPDAIAPTSEELQQVSQGVREFSSAEREWCVGEVMVRSHFERNPLQLLAGGDKALAALLLEDHRSGT
ncbi:MAG: hypothetical protein ABIP11_01320 [Luteimonas sp.]